MGRPVKPDFVTFNLAFSFFQVSQENMNKVKKYLKSTNSTYPVTIILKINLGIT